MVDDIDDLPALEKDRFGRAIPVTDAETALWKGAMKGHPVPFSLDRDVADPDAWAGDQTVRAAFLRHLLLKPDMHKISPKGVQIGGIQVADVLDLEFATLERPLAIVHSRLTHAPVFRQANAPFLNLDGSHLPGLEGDGVCIQGGLFLRRVTVTGEVRLLGTHIGRDLVCVGATFDNPDGIALNADGLDSGGDVVLDGASVTGEVSLVGAHIGGNLDCEDATFKNPGQDAFTTDRLNSDGTVILRGVTVTGNTRLVGAHIGGSLNCEGATFENPGKGAFTAQRLSVRASFFWRQKINDEGHIAGRLNLTHARVGDFVDDGTLWPQAGDLWADGFCYENLVVPTSAAQRKAWLDLLPETSPFDDKPAFWPQPHEQVIKVFRDAGHERDARLIAMAKQDAYAAYLKRKQEAGLGTNRLRRLWLGFIKVTAGYGYAPWRAFLWSALVIAIGWGAFFAAYNFGVMVPAKERVVMHACYSAPTACSGWKSHGLRFLPDKRIALPGDYPAFNPLTYAVDTFFPIVDLHQEDYWLPTGKKWFQDGLARLYLWLHIALGWVLTTIAVAGFTGLIKKD